MDFTEGNKVIDEFVFGTDVSCYGRQYQEDWSALMPVIEKLNALKDIRVHVSITGRLCNISTHAYLKQIEGENMKLTIWQSVVLFLTWYNQHR